MLNLRSRRADKDRARMIRTEPLRLNRSEHEDRLATETYDILIVGGGVTGAYCAFDASLRGFRVALVEKDDFASGTSSKSSKMVHGGLRYIEQGNLGLVRHSCWSVSACAAMPAIWCSACLSCSPFWNGMVCSIHASPRRLKACSGHMIWLVAGAKVSCIRS